MAFTRVTKGSTGTSSSGRSEDVRMGAHLQSGPGTSRGVYFSIPQSVAIKAGWTLVDNANVRKGVHLVIDEGHGEDAGFLMLSEDPRGYACGASREGAYALAMSITAQRLRHYVLNDCPVETEPVEFSVDPKAGTVLIQVPDWLRYNPLTAPQPEAPPPRPTKATSNAGDVADIPKLNRSERRALASRVASRLK